MKKIILLSFISYFFSQCTPAIKGSLTHSKDQGMPIVAAKSIDVKRPKNIIFMIGDGMGITQISAGYYMNKGQLNLLKFPYVGLHINYPAEDSTVITDSAAGATAFSIGEKTYNGAIGVGKDSLPRETIMETAKKRGLATGLVVTCNIQHATPASFVAHVKSRADYEPISEDILKSNIDLFIGGGKQYFDNRKTDNRNMLKELEAKGYQVSDWTKEDIEKVNITKSKFAYLTANVQPLTAEQGRDYLPFASKMACNFLQKSSPKGFFMMIEGSQIDWGGHAANSNYIINEMLDFDKAVGEVLNFAKQDGNTLVIITADHETGGYGLTKGSNWGKVIGQFADTKPDKSGSIYHTCDIIPVFAYGPGAEQFTGVYQNTAIYHKMKLLFGF